MRKGGEWSRDREKGRISATSGAIGGLEKKGAGGGGCRRQRQREILKFSSGLVLLK